MLWLVHVFYLHLVVADARIGRIICFAELSLDVALAIGLL
jgi:hypothetical protein